MSYFSSPKTCGKIWHVATCNSLGTLCGITGALYDYLDSIPDGGRICKRCDNRLDRVLDAIEASRGFAWLECSTDG